MPRTEEYVAKFILLRKLRELQQDDSDPEMNSSLAEDALFWFLSTIGHDDIVREIGEIERY